MLVDRRSRRDCSTSCRPASSRSIPGARAADELERPDRLIFDLDPGRGRALGRRDRCGARGARRLGGARARELRQDDGRQGAACRRADRADGRTGTRPRRSPQSVAETMAQDAARPLRRRTCRRASRRGRIFIDYLRNGRGATAVARLFDPRAAAGARSRRRSRGTSCPRACAPTISRSPISAHRLQHLKSDPWPGFFKIRQRIPKTKP